MSDNAPTLREIALARLWQDGRHAPELRTVDGRRVAVIYHGVWTHGAGPDFRDALLELDGALTRGAVELHLRASDWARHGHQHDPAYDAVVLHVVLRDDLPAPVSVPAGRPLPTVELASFLPGPLDELLTADTLQPLGALSGRACLPSLAGGRESTVREALRRAGWRRLADKRLRVLQELERVPPAQALYAALLDGLGLTGNRAGMARVAEALPLTTIERIARRDGQSGALAALLGVGGFLPLAPQHAALAGIEPDAVTTLDARFAALAREFDLPTLPATIWQLGRVRPANHPARRLASAAALLARCADTGLLETVIELASEPPGVWRRWFGATEPSLGRARADQLAVNAVAPFLAAYADASGDEALAQRASALWETLPGSADDAIASATLRQIVGERRFPISLAIEAQGLHEIGRHGCAELRCFECPIATLAARYEGDALTLQPEQTPLPNPLPGAERGRRN